MFGIGMPEMLLILAIALIVIGPKKLPDLAKSLGRALGEFKKATGDLKESLEIDTDLKDVKKAFDEMNQDIRGTVTEGIKQAEASAASSAQNGSAADDSSSADPLPGAEEPMSEENRQDPPDEAAAKDNGMPSGDTGNAGDDGTAPDRPEASASDSHATVEQEGSDRHG